MSSVGTMSSGGQGMCAKYCSRHGSHSMIGMGAVLLTGSRIGAGALVAAGAVVLEGFEVPAGTVAAGVPARLRGPVPEALRGRLAHGADSYVAAARAYRSGLVR